ncbi:hypothetical protein EC988_000488 [Linderina pennispora]|nr:hypothetical protein EC988_000488 [Linderina pennispora]
MSASISAAKLVRQLRQRAEATGTLLVSKAKKVAKLGAGPWLYASSEDSTASVGQRRDAILDKAAVNERIPVKPIYVAPRHPMVLCHGPEKLPLLQFHYWRGIREALEQIGAKVVVAKVASTGGVHERAQQLDTLLKGRLAKQKVNIVGHSMGGLDARYMITHVQPTDYEVSSLTTVCTPHRGSPFMDWCRDYLSLGYRVDADQLMRDFATVWQPAQASGLGSDSAGEVVHEAVVRRRIEQIVSQAVGQQNQEEFGDIDPADQRLRRFAQFLTDMLSENASAGESSQLVKLTRTSVDEGDYLQRSVALLRMAYRRIMATLDTPAYACLTTDYCNRFFNPATPDVAGVEYLSYGAQMDTGDVAGKVNPLTIPHDIIYRAEGPNDGLVSLTSAQWGHYLGTVTADHFDLTNRWRFSNIGKDFVGTMADWGSQWATWLRRKDAEGRASIDGAASAAKRFDAIEFYLRVGTTLYQRGF